MVDRAFINSHSYKLILSRDISVLKLLWEQRAASLNWNEAFTYLLASSVMLIQHGSSGQLYATFSASPSNWWASTPPDMEELEEPVPHEANRVSAERDCRMCAEKACDQQKQPPARTSRDGPTVWHRVWFGLDFRLFTPLRTAVALTSTFNIPVKG